MRRLEIERAQVDEDHDRRMDLKVGNLQHKSCEQCQKAPVMACSCAYTAVQMVITISDMLFFGLSYHYDWIFVIITLSFYNIKSLLNLLQSLSTNARVSRCTAGLCTDSCRSFSGACRCVESKCHKRSQRRELGWYPRLVVGLIAIQLVNSESRSHCPAQENCC